MTIFLIKIKKNVSDEKILIYYLENGKLKKKKLSEFRKYNDRIYMLDFDEENEKRIISRLETLKDYFLILKEVEPDENKARLLYVKLLRPSSKKDYKRLDKVKEKIKKKVKGRVIFFKSSINSILCIGEPEDISFIETIFTDKRQTGLEKIDEIDAYIEPLFLNDALYLHKHGIIELPVNPLDKLAFLRYKEEIEGKWYK